MPVMQEDGKLLPPCLALRRHGFLEQVVLNMLRQPAPNLGNSVSQGANNLLMSLSGKQIQSDHRRLPCMHGYGNSFSVSPVPGEGLATGSIGGGVNRRARSSGVVT